MTTPRHDYMDPGLREHFVYRAFDADGALLYVGCSLNPEARHREHRGQSRWYPLAATFKMQGPYNYDTARQIERDAIRTESPRFNGNEPHKVRVQALRRRVSNRWFDYHYASGANLHEAVHASEAHATRLMPGTDNLDGRVWTDQDISVFAKVEQADRFTHHGAMSALKAAVV